MYTERINKDQIKASFRRKFITTILGPRRVGKTAFVTHYADTHPELLWVFLNMDRMQERLRVRNEELEMMIQESARQKIGGEKKIWVVIDEAQKCPEVFEQVKILYDAYKDQDKVKFILTGSAVLSLHRLSAETLAGRIDLFHLYEFTLREAALQKEPRLPQETLFDRMDGDRHPEELKTIIDDLLPFKPLLEEQLKHHLIWGGLPEVLECTEEKEKINYLNNYIQTYLEKDIRAIEEMTNVPLYRQVMEVAAEQTGSVRDDGRILKALGCSRETLKKYRGFLGATLLYRDLFPYIGSALKRLVKSPKGYLMNNGIISILTGLIQLPLLEKSGMIGHRLENWFLNELSTWLAREPLRAEIYFWRLNTGPEVDFVVERKPKAFPFEVTYAAQPDRRKISNLRKFIEEESHTGWGYYIYRGPFQIDEENRICYVPAWAIG